MNIENRVRERERQQKKKEHTPHAWQTKHKIKVSPSKDFKKTGLRYAMGLI
jgi:hypothetical protein